MTYITVREAAMMLIEQDALKVNGIQHEQKLKLENDKLRSRLAGLESGKSLLYQSV